MNIQSFGIRQTPVKIRWMDLLASVVVHLVADFLFLDRQDTARRPLVKHGDSDADQSATRWRHCAIVHFGLVMHKIDMVALKSVPSSSEQKLSPIT